MRLQRQKLTLKMRFSMESGDHMGLHEKMIQLNQAVQKYTGKSGTTAVPDMIKRLTPGEATNLIFQKSDEIKYLTNYKFSSPIKADSKGLVFSVEVVNPLPERKIQIMIRLKKGSNYVGHAIFPVRDFKQNEKATLTVKYINGGTFDDFYLDDLNIDFQHEPKFYNLKVYRGDHIEAPSSGSSGNFTTVKSALSALGNAVRQAVGKSDLMTIDDMIALLGGTTSKDDTPATPSKTVTVFENLQFSVFGGGSYDFTSPVPSGDTRLEVTLQVVNSGTGSVTISIPGTSISKTIATGGRGYHDLITTLDIPNGMANSIKSINVDVGRRNALKQLTVVAK